MSVSFWWGSQSSAPYLRGGVMGAERENHFLCPSGHKPFHAAQDKICFLSCKFIAGACSVFHPSALSSSYQQGCFQSINATICDDIWQSPWPRCKILCLALFNSMRFTRVHSQGLWRSLWIVSHPLSIWTAALSFMPSAWHRTHLATYHKLWWQCLVTILN